MNDKNKILYKFNLNEDFINGIKEGLEYNFSNWKFVNSRNVKKLNKNYMILQNLETELFYIVDKNSLYVDDCKYYAYRIKFDEIYFGTKYQVDKFIHDNYYGYTKNELKQIKQFEQLTKEMQSYEENLKK